MKHARLASLGSCSLALGLAILMASPLAWSAPQQPAAQQQPATSQQQLPDAPAPKTVPPAESTQVAALTPPLGPNESSSLAQQAPAAQDADQQNPPQQPVGTAAAPIAKPSGVAGARPAGAAIAPAKQRRVKAFFFRTAIIIAAAGATGAVIGLSKASPSRPN